MIEQWSRLQLALTTCFNEDVTFTEGIENPFLKRLMNIITDSSAGQNDIFAGYADALRDRTGEWHRRTVAPLSTNNKGYAPSSLGSGKISRRADVVTLCRYAPR